MHNDDADPYRRNTLRLLGAASVTLVTGTAAANTSTKPVEQGRYAKLQDAIKGDVVSGASPEFDRIRSDVLWNRRAPMDSSPDAIVRVASEKDVVEALRFAHANRLKISLRSGGHNYHGSFMQKDRLLLDMGALRSIEVDVKARRASIGPGVKGGQLIEKLASLGLGFPVGHCSDTGVGGYLLGGGIGWNYGAWGPACMSVAGMQMVTAAGELLYADDKQNAELFWAARGAGLGFFAVVTRYDLALYEMPKAIHTLSWTFNLDSSAVVADWLENAVSTADPTVETGCYMFPPSPQQPAAMLIVAISMADSASKASAHFGMLRQPPSGVKILTRAGEQEADIPTLASAAVDQFFPNGKRMIGDVRYSNASLAELISASENVVRNGPPNLSSVMLSVLGQRYVPHVTQDAAYSMNGQVYFGAFSFWDDPAADSANLGWTRSVMQTIEPHAVGGYISETDLKASPGMARRCFSNAAWEKLAALRDKYDPYHQFPEYPV